MDKAEKEALEEKLEYHEAERERIIQLLGAQAESYPSFELKTTDFLHLDDPVAFNSRFEELLSEFKTGQQAYFAVESEYVRSYGKNKYSSYQSFKSARSRRLNADLEDC